MPDEPDSVISPVSRVGAFAVPIPIPDLGGVGEFLSRTLRDRTLGSTEQRPFDR